MPIKAFKALPYKLIIAGRNPSDQLKKLVSSGANTVLVENPSEKEMQHLVEHAQVNILLSYNSTGIKLKLLNALYNGRHCVTNEAGVKGTGLEKLCHIIHDESFLKQELPALMKLELTAEEINERQCILYSMFNNELNAKNMISAIYKIN